MPVEFAGHLVQADAVADRPPVRAGGGEAALEPALYQGLHLGLGESVSHLYGGVAGYGGEDMVFAAVARLGTRDGREGVLERAGNIPVGERGDHGRNPHGSRPERLGLEAVDGELLEVRRGPLGLGRREVDDLGDEEALHRRGAVRVVEPVQNGPLVGDVLVDDPEGSRLLHKDVARRELPYDAQFLRSGLRQTAPFGQFSVSFAPLGERFGEGPGSLGEPLSRLLQTTRWGRCIGGAVFGCVRRVVCRGTRGPRKAILGEGPFWRAGGLLWRLGTPLDGVPDGGGHGFAGRPLLREADDLLCGMDVHVDAAGVGGYLDGDGGVAPRRHGRPVGVVEAAVEVLGPDEAAVYRDRLVGPAALRQARKGRVARDTERSRLVLHLAQRARFADAQDLGQAFEEIPGLGQREVVSAALRQAEGERGMGYRQVRHDLHYRRALRPRALQKGASCGDIVEKPVDEDGRPLGVGGGRGLGRLPALDDDLRGRALARGGSKGERRDAGDRGEGLAPESQGGHDLDIFDVPDLARRVPEYGEARVAP